MNKQCTWHELPKYIHDFIKQEQQRIINEGRLPFRAIGAIAFGSKFRITTWLKIMGAELANASPQIKMELFPYIFGSNDK